ncbi:prolyl oligopeptidase [Glomus cerebriforme]|uniref:Prolyl endopeptidase n=1 Tax=Glomus cerebriforme TaxID=658196 RepID=A0A397SBP1_9GLOM|nr:prolyl oligopeptidase [Glomus cerebriforme]
MQKLTPIYLSFHSFTINDFINLVQRKGYKPPIPKQIPNNSMYFGIKRSDEFQWMQNPKNRDVLKYIKAENEYTESVMRSTKVLQQRLVYELRKKLIIPRIMAPIKTYADEYEYYTILTKYGIKYCRNKKGFSSTSTEEVLLDSKWLRGTNKLIRSLLISPDHNKLAYLVEQEGEETGVLHFKNLSGNSISYDEKLENVFNFVWGSNSKIIYYTISDEQLRPYKVYAHYIGSLSKYDILIYEEKDKSSFVDITVTKDKSFITVNSNGFSTSEIRVFDAYHDFSKEFPELRLIEPRSPGLEYYVDHHNGFLYILTNADNTRNFKLVRASLENYDKKNWETIFSVKDNEKIEDIDIFRKFAVIFAKKEGLPIIFCYNFDSCEVHQIELPTKFCVVSPETNIDYDTDIVRFTCDSPFAHQSIYEYNMETRKLHSVRSNPIHNFDSTLYTCYRIYANALDGVKIPITLLHKKSLDLDNKNPLLIRSYGAYGVSIEPDFQLEHLPLLERGWIIALAHVRGGSEVGYTWYDQGRLMNKRNSITDLISVIKYLIGAGYSNPSLVASIGVSAGGLLLGAAFNMRPDLFRAIVLRVPFLDPLSSMLNSDLPLTRVEYNEWGNPLENKEAYEYLASYAPYDNISTLKSQRTCSILVTAAMKDQRVSYWHPLKWVARMRTRQPSDKNDNLLILKVDMERGHFGAETDQSNRIKDVVAFELAFLISQVQK